MKAWIVYDSLYGNTEKVAQAIAQAIAQALGSRGEIHLAWASAIQPNQLLGADLVIIGSPTQRFNATVATNNLLKAIPKGSLRGVKVAAFDTRLTQRNIEATPVLGFFVRLWGRAAYAANHIADQLKKSGGELVIPAEGFFVEGMEGSLVEGELLRAADWARRL